MTLSSGLDFIVTDVFYIPIECLLFLFCVLCGKITLLEGRKSLGGKESITSAKEVGGQQRDLKVQFSRFPPGL